MYPDIFYEFLDLGIPWIAIALGFAALDYVYNLLMCSIMGGIGQIRRHYENRGGKKRKIFKPGFFGELKRNYEIGSQNLLGEFFADRLSWSWPLTVLAIPTFVYGVSRELTVRGISSLQNIGVGPQGYMFLPRDNYVQFVLWGLALMLGLRTFYRYQREKSKPTWFSRVWIFSFSRTLLFDVPLSFMVLSIIYSWLQYSFSIYQVLSSDQVQYTVLHPDLMYGLGGVYGSVIAMGVSLTVLSFLPTIMLIREKQEVYTKMYYFLVYGGILTLFTLLIFLVARFDQRLGSIQSAALDSIQVAISTNPRTNIETVANLEYFSLLSDLPGGFPIPAWVSFLLSARFLALFFELARVIVPTAYESSMSRFLQKVLGV